MVNPTFIIGSMDHEMSLILEMLVGAGCEPLFASQAGVRNPGAVYKADRASNDLGEEVDLSSLKDVVLIECDFPCHEWEKVTRIDHHRPGDFGLLATTRDEERPSIMQLHRWLTSFGKDHHVPLPAVYLVGGMDHDLPRTLRGEWPNVSREQAIEAYLKRCMPAFGSDQDKKAWQAEYHAGAPVAEKWGIPVFQKWESEGSHPLVTKIIIDGGKYFLSVIENGRQKISLGGTNTPEEVTQIMGRLEADGYIDIYGVPSRGFCGGYES